MSPTGSEKIDLSTDVTYRHVKLLLLVEMCALHTQICTVCTAVTGSNPELFLFLFFFKFFQVLLGSFQLFL